MKDKQFITTPNQNFLSSVHNSTCESTWQLLEANNIFYITS